MLTRVKSCGVASDWCAPSIAVHSAGLAMFSAVLPAPQEKQNQIRSCAVSGCTIINRQHLRKLLIQPHRDQTPRGWLASLELSALSRKPALLIIALGGGYCPFLRVFCKHGRPC